LGYLSLFQSFFRGRDSIQLQSPFQHKYALQSAQTNGQKGNVKKNATRKKTKITPIRAQAQKKLVFGLPPVLYRYETRSRWAGVRKRELFFLMKQLDLP